MRQLPSFFLVIVLAFLPLQAIAAEGGFSLPKGRVLLDMRFSDSQSVVLLQQQKSELAISRLAADGSYSDMELPRSLERSAGRPGLFRYALAPLGNALAVVEYNDSLVKASRLSVYHIGEQHVTDMPAWEMPEDFWPDSICWDEAGENVFVAARPYLRPQQNISIGVFQVKAARFTPLLLRSEVDLVRQLCFMPGTGELAVLCSAYMGGYPADDLVLLVNPDGNRTRIAHAQAVDAELQLLDDGTLLLHCCAGRDAKDWIMPASGGGFSSLSAGGVPVWNCQVSRDGRWTALQDGSDREPELQVLASDGASLTTGMAASMWRLSHDGSYLCCLDSDGQRLFFFELKSQGGEA